MGSFVLGVSSVASACRGAHPNSAAHPEPLKRRTVSFPSSRRPGGRER
jgi:hypothetical protein